MNKSHMIIRAGGTAVLTSVLAACGTQGHLPTDGLVAVTVHSPFAGVQRALQPQGLPFEDNHVSAVQYVKMRVVRPDGSYVRFTENGSEDPYGTRTFLELTPTSKSARIFLKSGTYTFESSGLTGNTQGTLLAFGVTPQTVITAGSGLVNLKLSTLIDEVTLAPALPLNSIEPGQTIDLALSVRSRQANGKRYTVPLSDFSIVRFESLDGSVLSSKLGARFTAPAQLNVSHIAVTAEILGYKLHPSDPTVGSQQPTTVTLVLPVQPQGGGEVDFERPGVSVGAIPQVQLGQAVTIQGTAEDNVGVDRVEVFEGTRLIGSTGDVAGVSSITFTRDSQGRATKNWVMVWQPDAVGRHPITVVATDPSGNETRVSGEIEVTEESGDPVLTRQDVVLASYGSASVGILPSGGLMSFGGGRFDGLGDFINAPTTATNVNAVTGSFSHGLGLLGDGTVIGWGGMLDGPDRPAYAVVPEAVNDSRNVVAVAAADRASYALKADGTLTGWGWGHSIGAMPSNPLPNVRAVTARNSGAAAIMDDGRVVAWGAWGGNPLADPRLNDVTDAVALTATDSSLFVLHRTGQVSRYTNFNPGPMPANLSNVVAISGGSDHVLALNADGTVTAWGCAVWTPAACDVPANLADVAAISAGQNVSAAVKNDGTIVTWGDNTAARQKVDGTGVVDGTVLSTPWR